MPTCTATWWPSVCRYQWRRSAANVGTNNFSSAVHRQTAVLSQKRMFIHHVRCKQTGAFVSSQCTQSEGKESSHITLWCVYIVREHYSLLWSQSIPILRHILSELLTCSPCTPRVTTASPWVTQAVFVNNSICSVACPATSLLTVQISGHAYSHMKRCLLL